MAGSTPHKPPHSEEARRSAVERVLRACGRDLQHSRTLVSRHRLAWSVLEAYAHQPINEAAAPIAFATEQIDELEGMATQRAIEQYIEDAAQVDAANAEEATHE